MNIINDADILEKIIIIMIIAPIIMSTIYLLLGLIKYNFGYNYLLNKAFIGLAWFITIMTLIFGFKVSNPILIMILFIMEIIILIWTIFTNFFKKNYEIMCENSKRNELYDEIIDMCNVDSYNINIFKNHMNRTEQIEFLKGLKYEDIEETVDETKDENGNKVIITKETIKKYPFLEDDEDLKKYESILKKR